MRRALGATAIIVLSFTLGACVPPNVDQAAAQEWLTAVSAERDDIEGLVGTAAGSTSPDTTEDEANDNGITLTPGTPVTASKAEALCFGGAQAELHIMVNTSGPGYGLQEEIVCDGAPHSVALGSSGAPLEGVVGMQVDVRTPSPTTYYVDVYA